MNQAKEKIQEIIDCLNSDTFQLKSGNNRMDDLRTMLGQAKVAARGLDPGESAYILKADGEVLIVIAESIGDAFDKLHSQNFKGYSLEVPTSCKVIY